MKVRYGYFNDKRLDWREFGQMVGPGWRPCVNYLAWLCGKHDIQIIQVKEKFGGLRFYVGEIPANMIGFNKAIHYIENLMETVCEQCGTFPKVTTEGPGWIKTLCPSCRGNRNEQRRERWQNQQRSNISMTKSGDSGRRPTLNTRRVLSAIEKQSRSMRSSQEASIQTGWTTPSTRSQFVTHATETYKRIREYRQLSSVNLGSFVYKPSGIGREATESFESLPRVYLPDLSPTNPLVPELFRYLHWKYEGAFKWQIRR